MQDEHQQQTAFSTRLVVGLIIIAIGTILLADNLGFVSARNLLSGAWPLAMVAVGAAMLRQRHRHRKERFWAWVLVVGGLWIFFDKVGWIDLSLWDVLVPGLLLFAGGTMVWRALKAPRQPSSGPIDEHVEFVRSFALLSGCELRPVSRPFRGADLNALMGGIKLDLSDARMEGDSAVIEVLAFWGGIEIYVPRDWTVTSKVTTLMGAFIDKRRPTTVVPTKTLIISGAVIMSGIEVKD